MNIQKTIQSLRACARDGAARAAALGPDEGSESLRGFERDVEARVAAEAATLADRIERSHSMRGIRRVVQKAIDAFPELRSVICSA